MSIQVKLVNAVLTHDTEFFANMDPYAILTLGAQTKRSTTKKQAGKRPVWNQIFNFNSVDNILRVVIMDKDAIEDDVVGEGTVDLARFRSNPAEQQQLCQLYYQGKTAGRVQMVIKGVLGNPNAWQAQQGNNINISLPNNNFAQNNNWASNNAWGGQQGSQNNIAPIIPAANLYNAAKPNSQNFIQANQSNQSPWGDLNQNNGWGNFDVPQSNNLYPSLDPPGYPPNNNNNVNPLGVMGQLLGQGLGQGGINNNNKPFVPGGNNNFGQGGMNNNFGSGMNNNNNNNNNMPFVPGQGGMNNNFGPGGMNNNNSPNGLNNPQTQFQLVNGMAGLFKSVSPNKPPPGNNQYGVNPYQ